MNECKDQVDAVIGNKAMSIQGVEQGELSTQSWVAPVLKVSGG